MGGVAGWLASVLMKSDGSQNTLMDIVLGIAGSAVGGLVMNFLGKSGVNGFNLHSFVVSVVGACILIAMGRMIR